VEEGEGAEAWQKERRLLDFLLVSVVKIKFPVGSYRGANCKFVRELCKIYNLSVVNIRGNKQVSIPELGEYARLHLQKLFH
jgi:hypothetical protein